MVMVVELGENPRRSCRTVVFLGEIAATVVFGLGSPAHAPRVLGELGDGHGKEAAAAARQGTGWQAREAAGRRGNQRRGELGQIRTRRQAGGRANGGGLAGDLALEL